MITLNVLQRLAASEEFVQFSLPDLKNHKLPVEMRDSVSSCLLKLGAQTYNPLNHERGLHSKLDWLAKESLQFHPSPAQRSQTNKTGHLPSNQSMDRLEMSSQILPGETKTALGSRGNDTERIVGFMNSSGKGRISQAGGTRPELFSKQAASNAMSAPLLTGAGSSCFSQLSLKPLLPLQMCPKPTNIKGGSSSFGKHPLQMQTEPGKSASEPVLLKTSFRRIKQGRVLEG